jgi:hypothetical protein
MAFAATASSSEARSFSIGPIKFQLMTFAVASGDTSGTITASRMSRLMHALCLGGGVLTHTSAPTYATNVATLAFTCPTATAATLLKGGVTYTAVASDNTGNNIRVRYTAGATAGAEVVTVAGNDITVQIEDGVSSITQVRTAVNASGAAAALVTATGTSATAVAAAGFSSLSGGITGGGAGTILCIGI